MCALEWMEIWIAAITYIHRKLNVNSVRYAASLCKRNESDEATCPTSANPDGRRWLCIWFLRSDITHTHTHLYTYCHYAYNMFPSCYAIACCVLCNSLILEVCFFSPMFSLCALYFYYLIYCLGVFLNTTHPWSFMRLVQILRKRTRSHIHSC